jgi:multidrug resistance efflux pump
VAAFDRQYMLLRLDDYRASVAQSESALTKQKAQLEITRKAHQQLIDSAKADLEKARLDMKTIPVLSAIDAERSKLAFAEAQARYDQLLREVKFVRVSEEADIRNAELDLAKAKIELKRAERNAERMVVKAPITGLVVMQNTFRGSEFAPIQKGDELWPGQSFMQIVNPSSMVINATVNQSDVQLLRVGAPARVRFDAYNDLELPARVEAIGAMTASGGQRASYVREVPVRLRIEKMDARVIPDLSVSVDVMLAPPQRAAAVAPLGAIFHSDARHPFVYVRESTGWESRSVETGIKNNLVAVIKRGLSPGEMVALDPPVVQSQ